MRQFEASVVAAAVKENLNKYRAANPFLSRIMDTISEVGDIYIVGGYIRNVYFGGRVRDIDMMVDIDGHMLRSIVQDSGCLYTYNRHGGMKLYVDSVVADIWTIYFDTTVYIRRSYGARLERGGSDERVCVVFGGVGISFTIYYGALYLANSRGV